jgi:hypothetical protein
MPIDKDPMPADISQKLLAVIKEFHVAEIAK